MQANFRSAVVFTVPPLPPGPGIKPPQRGDTESSPSASRPPARPARHSLGFGLSHKSRTAASRGHLTTMSAESLLPPSPGANDEFHISAELVAWLRAAGLTDRKLKGAIDVIESNDIEGLGDLQLIYEHGSLDKVGFVRPTLIMVENALGALAVEREAADERAAAVAERAEREAAEVR